MPVSAITVTSVKRRKKLMGRMPMINNLLMSNIRIIHLIYSGTDLKNLSRCQNSGED